MSERIPSSPAVRKEANEWGMMTSLGTMVSNELCQSLNASQIHLSSLKVKLLEKAWGLWMPTWKLSSTQRYNAWNTCLTRNNWLERRRQRTHVIWDWDHVPELRLRIVALPLALLMDIVIGPLFDPMTADFYGFLVLEAEEVAWKAGEESASQSFEV